MNLCSDKHEEVCYSCRNCPVCEMRSELQAEINELACDYDSIKDELDTLKNEI